MRVESVLEGCIQKLGNRFRVTARLLRVEDGAALWADKFDENSTDIFAVQDSISERVAAALATKLTGEEIERLTKRYTENTEAYHLYLKGRYYWNKRSEAALYKSIECFKQAIDRDPNYALAYVGLADCYTKLGDVGIIALPPKEAFGKAKEAAVKALEYDSQLAEAHTSLAHLCLHNYKWADAERGFRQAIKLSPNYATARHWYAYYWSFNGRHEDALIEIVRALEMDPLSLPINTDYGELLFFARRYDQAIEQLRKTLEMDPDYFQARIDLGRVYEQLGRYEEALAEYQASRDLVGDSPEILTAFGHVYAVSGRGTEARRLLEELREMARRKYVSAYNLAIVHAGLGESDQAFVWLELAYEQHAEWVIYPGVDPRLDGLRSFPRFTDLLRQVGLAP